ncbi:MAG TPA: cupin domain-containing protein [Candidatus Nanopelagicaceae bacterium]|nr:cupin domain-containing protein [Candidatus Nanopelagicaceae bacterium]
MPKQEMEFWDPFADGAGEWVPITGVDGLAELVLSVDEVTGSYTRLLKFEPGADTTPMGVQRHDFWEEVLIYKGAIHDLTLGQTFYAGQYACRPPGMAHGPWVAAEGCITFEIRTYRL